MPKETINRTGLKTPSPLHNAGEKIVPKKITNNSKQRTNATKIPKAYPQINQRFVQIRQEMELSQQALSERMGITKSMVKAIEGGVVAPNLYCIITLSNISGRTCDFILKGK